METMPDTMLEMKNGASEPSVAPSGVIICPSTTTSKTAACADLNAKRSAGPVFDLIGLALYHHCKLPRRARRTRKWKRALLATLPFYESPHLFKSLCCCMKTLAGVNKSCQLANPRSPRACCIAAGAAGRWRWQLLQREDEPRRVPDLQCGSGRTLLIGPIIRPWRCATPHFCFPMLGARTQPEPMLAAVAGRAGIARTHSDILF